MKKSILSALFASVAALAVHALPVAVAPPAPDTFRPTVKIGLVKDLTLKDAMDSELWNKVPQYHFMHYIRELFHINKIPAEGASVRYLCTDTELFVRVDMTDSDVMTGAFKDQDFHYAQGDVLEVFLKPLNHNYYWEIYGLPNKLFARFYFPAPGILGLMSSFGPTDVKIGVDSRIYGTFNDHNDRDKGWTVIIAIPLKELEKNGCKFAPQNKWTILTARYNYSAHLPACELSSFPQITGGYHTLRYYANVEFININQEEK